MSEPTALPGFAAVEISWTSAESGRITILAEVVTDHMVIHPVVAHGEDCDGYPTDKYRFYGTWTVTHRPSGLNACPGESLPSVETARAWARVVEKFPGIDHTSTDRAEVVTGVDADDLWAAWRDFRMEVWSS